MTVIIDKCENIRFYDMCMSSAALLARLGLVDQLTSSYCIV